VEVVKNMPVNGIFQAREGDDLQLAAVEFTRAHYKERFGCELTEFYPNTVSLYEDGVLTAAAGFRGAGTGKLFLEQYLDKPIESCIWAKFTPPAERHEIVELGGFAATSRYAALPLMLYLAPALYELGYKKLVCTANKPIQLCLRKLGLDPIFVADADQSKLIEPGENWGSYYKGRPQVFTGDIKAGIEAMAERAVVHRS
jgi:hypothetical protein